MRLIIIIEQDTQNIVQYVVRGRLSGSPVYHSLLGNGFQYVDDANDFADAVIKGAEFVGAEVNKVISEEISHELDLIEYKRDYRSFSFDVVWRKLS